MVNNTELRLGNLIKYNGKIYTVNMLIAKGIGVEDELHKEEDIYPIELSEELLISYGFYKQDYELVLNVNENGCLVYWHNEMFVMMGQFADCTDIVDCKYFHQLQNLYYSLTNEELTPI